MKNNKGITLIALIITIVVLLILAMVAISAVSDNGIIAKAQKAKDSYGDAANEENQTIGGYAAELEKYGGETKVDFEAILQDIIANKDNDKYPKLAEAAGQENTTDIGIGTDGKVVNLDWWRYYKKTDGNTVRITEMGSGYYKAYQGDIIDGKIQGTVPQYIYSEGEIYTVTEMKGTFTGMENLKVAPYIPETVKVCSSLFEYCRDLTEAPTIPEGVTDVNGMFNGCTSLENAPTIPSSVTDAGGIFAGCTNLTTAPTIPSSVTIASSMFSGCTSLKTAPTIPSSVTDAYAMFLGCTKLEGTINILSNEFVYPRFFLSGVGSAERPITLIGNGTNGNLLKELRATGNSDYITIDENG